MLSKVAVHSISWGHCPLEDILREAKEARYAGVELFQHPGELGGAHAIVAAFDKYDMHLVGVTSGSFDDRCRLVREIAEVRGVKHFDPILPYVYVDEWQEQDPRFKRAVDEGLRVALHPHMYKPVQTLREAEAILVANPTLRFLPNLAHLRIAGEDLLQVVTKPELLNRIDSIHLEDWREDVGRSYQFYARGFCELGQGDVDLRGVLDELVRRSYTGWYVVKQDATPDPLGSARRSADWLEEYFSSSVRAEAPR